MRSWICCMLLLCMRLQHRAFWGQGICLSRCAAISLARISSCSGTPIARSTADYTRKSAASTQKTTCRNPATVIMCHLPMPTCEVPCEVQNPTSFFCTFLHRHLSQHPAPWPCLPSSCLPEPASSCCFSQVFLQGPQLHTATPDAP